MNSKINKTIKKIIQTKIIIPTLLIKEKKRENQEENYQRRKSRLKNCIYKG